MKIVMRHASGKESSLTFKPDNHDAYQGSGQDLMWIDYEANEMNRIDVKECEAHEDERDIANRELERKIDAMLPDEIAAITKDASKWVMDHEEDTAQSLSILYRFAAQYWNDPAEIGRFVKTFLGYQIDGVLAARIERQE